jgi:pyruvate/2-oxoglutarate/acetoin dehydrogenase E1 component
VASAIGGIMVPDAIAGLVPPASLRTADFVSVGADWIYPDRPEARRADGAQAKE